VRAQPAPEDLGDGVWSVPVPIPGSPLAYTLVYALESARGPVLIDAGWEHLESWNALTGGLAAVGLDVSDVYGVVVTHHHADHSGLAGRVREASGAWIAMHAADAEIVRKFRRLRRESGREWEFAALRRAGASEAEINEVRTSPAHIDPPAIPDRELSDGDVADLPGRKLRVIWTPGHSPGHVCLHLEDSDRLFTGDHVLPTITPNVGLYAFEEPAANPLADFLDSLARVGEIGAKEALPAHEYRFTDLGDRIDAIAAHHEERLAEIREILADGSPGHDDATGSGSRSVTVWEVASRMRWHTPFAGMHPMHRRLAAGEAAAHLRLLERRGLVRLVPGSDPTRYAAGTQRTR